MLDTPTIIAVLVLTVSEVLPFIKEHEANGVIHLIYLILLKFLQTRINSEIQHEQSSAKESVYTPTEDSQWFKEQTSQTQENKAAGVPS